VFESGTRFEYSQRAADLLAYVVQRAVGQDLQTFAQRNLFDPIGVPSDGYFWLRDRSGNTYGYAHLFIAPKHYARLGLLMQNDGTWNGQRVLSTDYIDQLREPTSTNGCYGFMFWVNAGQPCIGANIPKAQTVRHRMITSAPKDLYAMVGALQQNNFVIPSLDMTVSWTGAFGDTSLNLSDLASASPGADLYHNFFRILMGGVTDVHVPDPGQYQSPPLDLDIDPTNYADPRVLLTDLAPHPSCNVLFCDGTIPTKGLLQNGEAILGSVRGVLAELARI
jgi:CubicO group peptidase (beta-lactamase class C family)